MVEMWSILMVRPGRSPANSYPITAPIRWAIYRNKPGPCKTLVARHTGLCEVSFRLPLTPASDATITELEGLCSALEIELSS